MITIDIPFNTKPDNLRRMIIRNIIRIRLDYQ